jgi:ABC-2 type transport system permease protein
MKINANLYRKELKLNRSSFIAWSIAIFCVIYLGMAFFPILMKGDMLKQVTAFLENPYMKSIVTAFGQGIEALTNVLGFYGARNSIFIMLLGSFFSMLLAGRILAKEESEKTAEFLVAKPVTRSEIAISKLAAFLTYLVLLNTAILIAGFTSLEIFKGESRYSLGSFFILTFYSFLLMLTFGALGFALSLFIKRGRSMSGLTIGIIVGGYFLDALSKITPSVDKIGYLSPFKFVDTQVLRPGYGLVRWRVLYFLGLSAVLIILSVAKYRKKDILI